MNFRGFFRRSVFLVALISLRNIKAVKLDAADKPRHVEVMG
jgi:hypothetical protein